jgi:tetratricopeptide (TPR) repeat protein
LEQALVVYQKAANAAKAPELQAEAFFRTAAILRAQGNVDEASKVYQRAATLKGVDDITVQALWENGQAQLKAQNWAAALDTFGKLIKQHPDTQRAKDAMLQIAAVHFQRGQFDEAARSYDQFLGKVGRSDPLAATALLGKIQVLARQQDWAATVELAQEFLKSFEANEHAPQAKLYRGIALQEQGQTNDALKQLESLIEEHPNTEAGAMAQMRLAEHYFAQKNFAKAQEQFTLIGKNFPNSSVAPDAAYFAALSAYKFKQDLNLAKKLAAKYLELYANGTHSFEARMLQGDILTEQQDYSGALVVFDNLIAGTDIAKRPDLTHLFLSARGRKGELLRILEKYDDAITAFQAILDMPNVDLDLVYNTEVQIARCYEKKGEPTKALEHYLNVIYSEKAASQAAESFWFAKAGLNAATLKEEQKDFSGAAKILQRMVKSNAACKTLASDRLKQIKEMHPELP